MDHCLPPRIEQSVGWSSPAIRRPCSPRTVNASRHDSRQGIDIMKTRVKHFIMTVALGWSFYGCGHADRPVNHPPSSTITNTRAVGPSPLIITGAVLSSAGYMPGLTMGLTVFENPSHPERLVLLVPVVGPILWVAGLDENTCGQPGNLRCDVSRPLWLVASGAQVAGLTLFLIDHLRGPTKPMQSMQPRWTVQPMAIGGGAGLEVGGRF